MQTAKQITDGYTVTSCKMLCGNREMVMMIRHNMCWAINVFSITADFSERFLLAYMSPVFSWWKVAGLGDGGRLGDGDLKMQWLFRDPLNCDSLCTANVMTYSVGQRAPRGPDRSMTQI